ncbi:aspartate--tRNA(Asn) ligase [Stackebrandtia soli]|uniref:aspartate--tRNA(Asn) ligase n=1 Tax=Stackebrandtia soli TaxID=1892856 RepID=UPI0039E9CEAC
MFTMEQPSPAVAEAPPRVLAAQLPEHIGQTVRVAGWLHRLRELKSVAFLVVRDRTGQAQAVIAESAVREIVAELPEESIVEVIGTATANTAAPGGVELTAPTVRVLSQAERPPFDLYRPALRAGLATMLDHAPVSLRHPRRKAALRIGAAAIAGFAGSLSGEGFTRVQTPKLVGTATESGSSVFGVDYFGRRAFLAQSPQFYKQTMVGVFERVFEIGPVFRAEPHDTVRHLAEYTSLDAELGFIDDYRDVAEVCVGTIRAMLANVAESAEAELSELDVTLPVVPERVPHIHFTDALAMAAEATGEDVTGVNDLSPAHERLIGAWALAEHGSDLVVVSGYPMSKRPFYTAPDPARPEYSDSFDVLFRGTELVTGGRRLHLYGDYVAAIEARGESAEAYSGYLEAFRYGMPPHGGFAIGLERFVAQLTGASNIREVTAFPRDLHRLTP